MKKFVENEGPTSEATLKEAAQKAYNNIPDEHLTHLMTQSPLDSSWCSSTRALALIIKIIKLMRLVFTVKGNIQKCIREIAVEKM
jgi:hypothetical protein